MDGIPKLKDLSGEADYKFVLRALKVAQRLEVPQEDLDLMEISRITEKLGNAIYHVNRIVYSDILPPEKVPVEIPASFWQHFKEDYFPECLKKISPVKYKIVQTDVDYQIILKYPNIQLPEMGERFTEVRYPRHQEEYL